MSKKTRVTRRTDSHGRVKDVYRDVWDRELLDVARRAGIPEKMLAPEGSDNWRSTGDTLGLWAELVYVLSDCLRGVDHLDNERRDNVGIVEDVFSWMIRIAQGLDVDPELPGLIPWDVWEIRRALSPRARVEERTREEIEAAEGLSAAHAQVVEGVSGAWGMPSGPGHDSHRHGLSNGYWTCFEEPESV